MANNNRIFYFLSHPIQYFSPLLRDLAAGTALEVFYFSDASIKGEFDKGFGQKVKWDTPLLEGYNYTFLKNYSRRPSPDNRLFDVFNPGVLNVLRRKGRAVVIVNGWSYSSTLMVILFARMFGKKVWLRAENPLNQELRKSRKVLFLKKIILRHFLFRFVNRFLYIGQESRRFFEWYGIKPSRLLYTPYAVDNDWFQNAARDRAPHRDQLRQRLGIDPGKKVILFCGKYIPKKRPLDLLRAFQQLNDPRYCLVMVGEGELREEMQHFIKENNLGDIILTGFVNQSAIADYYAIADVFVMCSGMGETWGLAVNEAMNFQLPVIVSDTCGCHADLVQPGVNGYVYKEGDIDALTLYIKNLLSDSKKMQEAGSHSISIVEQFSNKISINNIREALRSAF